MLLYKTVQNLTTIFALKIKKMKDKERNIPKLKARLIFLRFYKSEKKNVAT